MKIILSRLSSLLLLFQRTPVVQMLFPEANILGGSSLANSIGLAVTTVVGLGAYDSVAGQSQISERTPLDVLGKEPAGTSPIAANAINVPATVSAPLTFNFNWDPLNDFSPVESWRCTTGGVVDTLPAGLSPAFDANTTDNTGLKVGVGTWIPISGTPTAAPGIYPVQINVYRRTSYSSSTAAQIFNICVLGFSTQPAPSTTISSGGSTTLTCVAAGIPVPTTLHTTVPVVSYQWYRGTSGTTTTPVGTNSASYTTPNLTNSTNYWVKVTSVLGASTVSANSNTAAVNVTVPTSVSVAVAPTSVAEDGVSNLVYTFTRSGDTAGALTASFSVGGTATFSGDYTQTGAASFSATSGTVAFTAGSATATVTVDPTADTTVEPNETVILTVTSGAGYSVGSPSSATGTITNDDTAYSSWASVLPPGQNGPNQTPQNDGVKNLLKFAFNLNPLAPDVRHLTVGATNETAGLPCGTKVGTKLRLEFLRRKASTNPGITYTAQFGSNLAVWTDIPVGTPPGTSIDATWERVVVDDPVGGTNRFGRVKVIQTP